MDGHTESKVQSVRRVIRDSAATFILEAGGIERLRSWRGRAPGFDRTLWRQMAERGWLGLTLPVTEGGSGFGPEELATLAEELGRCLIPEPVVAAGIVPAVVLGASDLPLVRNQILPAVLSGSRLLTLAWQEQEIGLDPGVIAATATEDGDSVVLDGVKRAVWAAAAADGFLVAARGPAGLALYLVDRDTPGTSLDIESLADGGFVGTLTLAQARIPADRCLASPATALKALVGGIETGALAASAELLGLAEQLFAVTLNHLRERRQFGAPIGSFQALQHRCADLRIQLDLARASLGAAVAAFQQEGDPVHRLALVSAAKARASALGLRMSQEAVQLHGAHGCVGDRLVALCLKRALILAASFGGEAEHRQRHAALAGALAANRTGSSLATAGGASEDESFRREVRGWIEANYPPPLRHCEQTLRWAELRFWYQALARQGWIAPSWPAAHGGQGWSTARHLILVEEMERFGCARLPEVGPSLVGPLLIRYGSEEQQQRFLPRILSGDDVWVQGYSEPEAGSDLASLQTEAVRDGDAYVVSGTKTWVLFGQDANWMAMLVRTVKTARPQQGISVLLADLTSPGVTVRPIATLTGAEDLAEVTFDRVRVPVANLVGQENQGWAIAKTQLGIERLHIGHPGPVEAALHRLEELAAALGRERDPVFRDRLAALRLDVADHSALYERFADRVRHGAMLGPEVATLKVWASETRQRIADLMVAIAGTRGLVAGTGSPLSLYLGARALSIAGGSNEIQRAIIARHVLSLP